MKKPRRIYIERGLVSRAFGRETSIVGYAPAGSPRSTPLLTKDEARDEARRLGMVAEFKRI